MTFTIPKATRITPEELREHKYVKEIRFRASRMTDWDVEMLADHIFAQYSQPTMDTREIQDLCYRIRSSYDYTIMQLHLDLDNVLVWAYLFSRERELMLEDCEAYRKATYPEPTPISEPIVSIPLGSYPVAELRKAIKKARHGKEDILIRTKQTGLFVSDWHRMTDNTIEQYFVRSHNTLTSGILITLPGMELSYPGKNGGILDVEVEGDVTIAIEGENLCFHCGNWTYRLKNWERQS